jgi:anaerobic glycerol-3-phosphate dehydrogenase
MQTNAASPLPLLVKTTPKAHADVTCGGHIRKEIRSAETVKHIPSETDISRIIWATTQRNAAGPLPLLVMATPKAHADVTCGGNIRKEIRSAETVNHIPKETDISKLWATTQKNAAGPLPLIDPL